MNFMLRTKRLIGPFWSQLILLAAGLLLAVPSTAAGPVYTIGHECDPAAFAATWSRSAGSGPVLTSVTASTAAPGTWIVRGHGFSTGDAVEIAAYDGCGVDRHAQGQTIATDVGVPHAGSAHPEVQLLQDGLVTWTFTIESDRPLTIRAHDVATGTWTNAILVEGTAGNRAACDRECQVLRGIGPTP
jgi:hypothetical protein